MAGASERLVTIRLARKMWNAAFERGLFVGDAYAAGMSGGNAVIKSGVTSDMFLSSAKMTFGLVSSKME